MNANDLQRLTGALATGWALVAGGVFLVWLVYGMAMETSKKDNLWHWRLGWLILGFGFIALLLAALTGALSVWN